MDNVADLELSKEASQEDFVREKNVERMRHEQIDATFWEPSTLTSTPHDERFGAPSSSPTLGFWTGKKKGGEKEDQQLLNYNQIPDPYPLLSYLECLNSVCGLLLVTFPNRVKPTDLLLLFS